MPVKANSQQQQYLGGYRLNLDTEGDAGKRYQIVSIYDQGFAVETIWQRYSSTTYLGEKDWSVTEADSISSTLNSLMLMLGELPRNCSNT